MIQYITIEKWWNDLLNRYKGYMGAGYELLEFLDKKLKKCEVNERSEIINFLTSKAVRKDKGFAIALAVLENYCSPANLDLIFEKAKTIELSDIDIIYYLRVIGKQGNEEHLGLLEDFLLSPKLNPNHSFVHWSIYPNFPNLFVKAYSRFLIKTDYKVWTGSIIVQAFMHHPEALQLLRYSLEKENKNVWRKLKNDLESELTKNITVKGNKEQVRKIITV